MVCTKARRAQAVSWQAIRRLRTRIWRSFPPVGMSLTRWIGLAWMRVVTTPTRGAGSFEGFGLEEDLLSISIVGCVDDAVVSEVQKNRRRVASTGILERGS